VLTKTYDTVTDKELMQRYRLQRNTEWLGVLLQRYSLLLLGTCIKYLKNTEEAKDAAQQVCLKVIGELEKYEVEYFKSWLYMIAKNHCLMQLRNKTHFKPEEVLNFTPVPAEDMEAKPNLNKQEVTYDAMYEALQELTGEQKACVEMFYLQKKSYAEIANDLQLNLMQVKSAIQNGKRNLKIKIENKISNK
jgi:RNA polymerase sigma factor (sigma-70 family)